MKYLCDVTLGISPGVQSFRFLITTKIILVFTLCIVFCSCKDEQVDPGLQCENLVLEFGPFELSDSGRNAFPYSDDIERLVFLDDLGNEYTFDLDHFGTSITSLVFQDNCPYDTAQEISFVQNMQALTSIFVCDTLGLTLNLQFAATARLSDTIVIAEDDLLNLYIIKTGVGFSPALSFQLVHKYGSTYWPQVIPQDTVTINQRAFSEVYFQPLGQIALQKWVAYFNYEYGIVGLAHESGFPKLSLERIE